jgi:chemotaxis protein CheD
MPEKQLYVDTGEGVVVSEPCILGSLGIGSCIVICLFDRKTKVSGIAHILLGHAPKNPKTDLNPLRFGDSAIDILIGGMRERGSDRKDIVAKIFGGARLFKSEFLKVGDENVAAVKEKLAAEGIKVVAEDTGGEHGRNVWFDTKDGSVVVGTVFGPTKEY